MACGLSRFYLSEPINFSDNLDNSACWLLLDLEHKMKGDKNEVLPEVSQINLSES